MVPENIHTPLTEGIGNSGETQKFKAMYEAKLEFPEGWGGGGGGVIGQIPSMGGNGYFLEPNIHEKLQARVLVVVNLISIWPGLCINICFISI